MTGHHYTETYPDANKHNSTLTVTCITSLYMTWLDNTINRLDQTSPLRDSTAHTLPVPCWTILDSTWTRPYETGDYYTLDHRSPFLTVPQLSATVLSQYVTQVYASELYSTKTWSHQRMTWLHTTMRCLHQIHNSTLNLYSFGDYEYWATGWFILPTRSFNSSFLFIYNIKSF